MYRRYWLKMVFEMAKVCKIFIQKFAADAYFGFHKLFKYVILYICYESETHNPW